MADLPTLKPVEPVAFCGLCNQPIYPDGKCVSGFTPSACPLNGEEWRQMQMALAMRNAYVRGGF
jgi:hypothetical protein